LRLPDLNHDIPHHKEYKIFSLAGLRLGWIKANAYVIHQINVRRDYSMISTGPLVDKLGWIALKHKDELILRAKNIISTIKISFMNGLKRILVLNAYCRMVVQCVF